ncbi:hypothetical protein [Bacillus sp. ISL-37]|uniref:hypothetical protein n=1 Tax=Bacillus sp. ISL-37 TaxID=2819123 RepID=UPI001BE7BB55|nr:hypothetical protein [Bacillus sp. ISL-37]MBT2682671.1 hypothetical protein [Bacillus sp. ISL-37]
MAIYLQFDGVDDYVLTPSSLTFNRIELIHKPRYISNGGASPTGWVPFIRTVATDTRLNKNDWSQLEFTNLTDYVIDGVVYNTQPLMIEGVMPYDKKQSLFLNLSTLITDATYFYSNRGSGNHMAGDIYDIKFYNGAILVAHYDTSTGTVQDQSGNGNHATLTGGTWLDDGAGGGDTGTDGTTAFDLRQSIYESALTQADTKQIAYADGTLATDLRQLLYADQSQATDTRIAIYQDGASAQDTAQVLYEMSSAAFDTLQEIFNDGQVGATPFDIRVRLYEDNSAQLDTAQAVYDGGLLRYDVAQVIYESNTAVADVKAVIYADSALRADAMQTIYADGTFDADTLQRILAEFSEYSEVVRIVLEITQRRRDTLAITQQQSEALEIVQRRTIELNL